MRILLAGEEGGLYRFLRLSSCKLRSWHIAHLSPFIGGKILV